MKEIHGVRVRTKNRCDSADVVVQDGDRHVLIDSLFHGAALTPQEAEKIADCLMASAKRVRFATAHGESENETGAPRLIKKEAKA